MYVKPLLTELLMQSHSIDKELPTYSLFRDGFSLFNEEVGEMSFSVLARLVTSKKAEVELDTVNKLYILIHEYTALDDDLLVDTDVRRMRNGYTKMDPYGPVADGVTAFFTSVLQRIKFNSFCIYSGKAEYGNPVFLPVPGAPHPVQTLRPVLRPLWRDNIREILLESYAKLKKSLAKPVPGLREHWPEFNTLENEIKGHRHDIELNRMRELEDELKASQALVPEDDVVSLGNDSLATLSPDEDAPLMTAGEIRAKKYVAELQQTQSKDKTFKTSSDVWTIDYPDEDEPDTAWRVTQGYVLPRARSCKRKGALGTPKDCERIQASYRGSLTIFDIPKINLNRYKADAYTRLNIIKRRLGLLPGTIEERVVQLGLSEEVRLERAARLADLRDFIRESHMDLMGSTRKS